ncbi:uncharacterized protein LOC127737152 [Mytilus californianus]|uniref:uncharacterized protein LOC127737152 n=1 Tax=Mytilus californianus TaxID=6549 RepID=UPI002248545C|nr:uncharacterized protein LOC127737152 [Mytilus californianus]
MNRTLDRNFVLQKQLERSFKGIEKEYKSSQRRNQCIAESCVSFTYQLLHEATLKEKENFKKRPKTAKPNYCNTHDRVTEDTGVNNTRLRPQTAHGQYDKTDSKQKRPSSAHPLIPHDENKGDEQCDAERKDSFQKPKNALTRVKEIVQKTNSLNPNVLNEKRNSQDEQISIENVPITYDTRQQNRRRPKTADFYRKKQPESELAIFWSRKIRYAIDKWDLEDNEDDFIENDTISVASRASRAKRPLTPPVHKTEMTETEKRLKAFVRRFGSKYRTQMNLSTATSGHSAVTTGGRKNFSISRQELASIHGDVSRRLKNTKMIIKKSGTIQRSVEKYAEYAKELSSEGRSSVMNLSKFSKKNSTFEVKV